MLKGKLEECGINPKIIQQYLTECLEVTKEVNDGLMADIDPIAYTRTELTIVQVELLLLYLS